MTEPDSIYINFSSKYPPPTDIEDNQYWKIMEKEDAEKLPDNTDVSKPNYKYMINHMLDNDYNFWILSSSNQQDTVVYKCSKKNNFIDSEIKDVPPIPPNNYIWLLHKINNNYNVVEKIINRDIDNIDDNTIKLSDITNSTNETGNLFWKLVYIEDYGEQFINKVMHYYNTGIVQYIKIEDFSNKHDILEQFNNLIKTVPNMEWNIIDNLPDNYQQNPNPFGYKSKKTSINDNSYSYISLSLKNFNNIYDKSNISRPENTENRFDDYPYIKYELNNYIDTILEIIFKPKNNIDFNKKIYEICINSLKNEDSKKEASLIGNIKQELLNTNQDDLFASNEGTSYLPNFEIIDKEDSNYLKINFSYIQQTYGKRWTINERDAYDTISRLNKILNDKNKLQIKNNKKIINQYNLQNYISSYLNNYFNITNDVLKQFIIKIDKTIINFINLLDNEFLYKSYNNYLYYKNEGSIIRELLDKQLELLFNKIKNNSHSDILSKLNITDIIRNMYFENFYSYIYIFIEHQFINLFSNIVHNENEFNQENLTKILNILYKIYYLDQNYIINIINNKVKDNSDKLKIESIITNNIGNNIIIKNKLTNHNKNNIYNIITEELATYLKEDAEPLPLDSINNIIKYISEFIDKNRNEFNINILNFSFNGITIETKLKNLIKDNINREEEISHGRDLKAQVEETLSRLRQG